MKRITTGTGLLLITSIVTACGGLLTSESPAKQVYLLEPYMAVYSASENNPLPTLVISVTAVPGLDTDHILALGSDAQLNHYANARWADYLPEVLTSVIRRSVMSTKQFEAVIAEPPSADGSDWQLMLEVQQFYGIQNTRGATSSVEVRFEGSLSCNDNKHHLLLTANKIVAQERLSTIVAAHQGALDDVTRQLLEQFNSNCSTPSK